MASRQEARTLIFETASQVAPFIEDVVEAANRERLALGFFPTSLFNEQARKGNLFVAVRLSEGPKLAYAGHLMFDARRARASVLQLHVIPELQGHGIAQRLLGRLKAHLEELGFISIHARVAEDLKQANRFWERNGFYVQSIVPGGKTRDRTILIRCHELTSQQLFERSGITGQNPFGLDISYRTERPIYLLDLNVLLDFGPRRPRRDAAVDLFRAERFGSCELALSAELQEELARNLAAPGRTDPMLAWATTFITFPVPPKVDKERLIADLGGIVFPTPATDGAFTPNEQSDLTHLATAIHHRLAGFITSDDAVLAAAPVLEEKYGIEVISPTAFQPNRGFESDREEMLETGNAGESIMATTFPAAGESELRQMLTRLGIADADAISLWGAADSTERIIQRTAVLSEGHLVGYLACTRQVEGSTIFGRLAIDERQPNATQAARLLLNRLLTKACDASPVQVRVHLAPRQVIAREIAALLGFAGSEDGAVLSKLVVNRVVTVKNWSATTSSLHTLAKLRLPATCPPFRDFDQQVEVHCPDGNRRFVRLQELESGLSPAIFCLPGRDAVITPILREFAEPLLGHSRQDSFLPRSRASQYSERHYISSKKTLKLFAPGTIILFYESSKGGGSSSIVAIARVQRAYLKADKATNASDLDPSVLSAETLSMIGLSGLKTVTAFDNVIHLPRPVGLTSLKRLGCGESNQLITTRRITPEQLERILEEGFAQ